MKITTIGIDLAKDKFQLHAVNSDGKVIVKKQMSRNKVLEFFANTPPCLVGMEACGGSHYWAREISRHGHTVKLMAPQFVKPYVKSNKNDVADAEAICETVTRPNMRFVSIKNTEQQAILSVHRARQGLVKARTAQTNQIRGFLAEFGIVMPKGITAVFNRVPEILEEAENGIPGTLRNLLQRLTEHLKELDKKVDELETEINHWHLNNENSRKLAAIPGIGPLTASAIIATVGKASDFKSGRQMAAWFGLVPKQNSSGGKQNLLSISKRGDAYIRILLIHGARAVAHHADKSTAKNSWLLSLVGRRNKNVAIVALANKNARIVWAILTKNSQYDSNHISVPYYG
jgi:transposase